MLHATPIPPWVPPKENGAGGAHARSETSPGPRVGTQEGGGHLTGVSDVSFCLVPGLGQPCSGERSTQHPPACSLRVLRTGISMKQ